MALAGVKLETLVSEPDALTTRPPPCAQLRFYARLCHDTWHTALKWEYGSLD